MHMSARVHLSCTSTAVNGRGTPVLRMTSVSMTHPALNPIIFVSRSLVHRRDLRDPVVPHQRLRGRHAHRALHAAAVAAPRHSHPVDGAPLLIAPDGRRVVHVHGDELHMHAPLLTVPDSGEGWLRTL